jgi:hypothetical protein
MSWDVRMWVPARKGFLERIREFELMLHAHGRLHTRVHALGECGNRFSVRDQRVMTLRHCCLRLTRRVVAEWLLLVQIGLLVGLLEPFKPRTDADACAVVIDLANVGTVARTIEVPADDLMRWIRAGTFAHEIAAEVTRARHLRPTM